MAGKEYLNGIVALKECHDIFHRLSDKLIWYTNPP